MKLMILSLAAAMLLAAGAAHANCTYPRPPQGLPNGATATDDDMREGRQAVMAYNSAINAYTECLAKELETAIERGGEELTDQQKRDLTRMRDQKHNAAIDELESVASRFNEQVRVFRERTEKEKKAERRR
jgi:hypothetical protein